MSLPESLKHVMLFAGLDQESLVAIARIAVDRRAPEGYLIFSEGQPADGLYVVIEGKVKVFKLAADGRQQILHVFGPGQAFAEAAMFAGETFPAFAETMVDSRLAFFPRDRFLKGLAENPAMAAGLIATLARLCRQLTTLVEQIALTDVSGRVARYLTDLARRKGVELKKGATVRLDMPKGELARHLGTAPETLSRALARLALAKVIEVDAKMITVTSARRLEALARGEAMSDK
jgi:CRP/FNR family transcriptional regulator